MKIIFLLRNTFLLHNISIGDIITPDIILPFLQTNQTTENISRMNPYSHININRSCLTNSSKETIKKSQRSILLLHLIASIIANPIRTMLMAWFGLETGSPETQ